MSLFQRQKWDMATLIFDGDELEHCRVRMRLIMPKVILTLFNVYYKLFYAF